MINILIISADFVTSTNTKTNVKNEDRRDDGLSLVPRLFSCPMNTLNRHTCITNYLFGV